MGEDWTGLQVRTGQPRFLATTLPLKHIVASNVGTDALGCPSSEARRSCILHGKPSHYQCIARPRRVKLVRMRKHIGVVALALLGLVAAASSQTNTVPVGEWQQLAKPEQAGWSAKKLDNI